MKKAFIILTSLFLLSSCEDPGVTRQELTGNEVNLPEELKGLKVYNVAVENGNQIKVAFMEGFKSSSTSYRNGKIDETTILLESTGRVIKVKEIISETDSIIVIKK
jgi:hypothetical protein